jgi:hypothetical protein
VNAFFNGIFDDGAIRFRDAFFGGRTNVEKMLVGADNKHVIKYVDIKVIFCLFFNIIFFT